MNQKLETWQRQPLPKADTQKTSGPHFEPYRNSTESSGVQPVRASNLPDQPQCDAANLHQPPCVSTRSIQNELVHNDSPEENPSNVLVTVLMPCLNEARTLAACIQQAHAGCQAALSTRNISRHALACGSADTLLHSNTDGSSTTSKDPYTHEILIADNGSTDGSPEIAMANGARVVHVEQKGYGAALRDGIAAARGKYIVMGDSDCSYDFGEVPRFLEKLEEGNDLVMGNRFAGGIIPGAMPWHHRYIGNPILSGIGRFLYGIPITDWHCGLRAFACHKILDLKLSSSGMEFASELVIRSAQSDLSITEISVSLYPDGRQRPPHLRSFRDGLRHLFVLLQCVRSSRTLKKAHQINESVSR